MAKLVEHPNFLSASERATETEKVQSGDYFDKSADRYYDQISETTVIKVFSGDCYVTNQPKEMMVTVLGSCVAACIRDPIARIGGMNHFLLPDAVNISGISTRYGAYAMEQLINGIITKGGHKNRLEVKLFGGGNVIDSSTKIGERNCLFVRNYMKNEGLHIVKEDLGGISARRIHYYPDTGKVMMRKLKREEDYKNVSSEEKSYQSSLNQHVKKDNIGSVELF